MLKIAPVADPRGPEEIDEVSRELRQSAAVIERLTQVSRIADNRGQLLSPMNRLELGRRFGAHLGRGAQLFTQRGAVLSTGPEGARYEPVEQPVIGLSPEALRPELYASRAVEGALVLAQVGRCAWCESPLPATGGGMVRHYRPPGPISEPPHRLLVGPGYPNLAYEWTNLLYTCDLCERWHRVGAFPVIGPRAPAVPLAQERPVLPNPRLEDPRTLLRVHPWTARVFPFDLTAGFLAASRGLSPAAAETAIRADPRLIPDQRDGAGQLLTDPAVQSAFARWMGDGLDPALVRGFRSIQLLGLNRPPLVRSRAAAILALRALWSTLPTALGDALRAPDPLLSRALPPFGAALIDAARAWWAGAPVLLDELALRSLDAPSPAELCPPPPPDPLLMFQVSAREPEAAEQRLLHRSSADPAWTRPREEAVLLAPLDWPRALDRPLLARRPDGRVVARGSLRDWAGRPNFLSALSQVQIWATPL